MSISGIDRITYGVDDLDACQRFFSDWGLTLVQATTDRLAFETQNGCEVWVKRADDPSLPPAFEAGPTLREVIWAAESPTDLAALRPVLAQAPGFHEGDDTLFCLDPNGIQVGVRVSRKREVATAGAVSNAWGNAARIDQPAPVYEKATPIEVGHVVLFTPKLAEATGFYETLGFRLSDRYPGRGHFMRCADRGGHHDLFLLHTPDNKLGLNHIAFTVRDIYEVFGGGLHMARCGWQTQLGPGRHPISSAFFWYFQNPAGALVEYYADEDVLTENWTPRDFEPGPTVFAEWAVAGGLDGFTRRQAKGVPAETGKFLTDRR